MAETARLEIELSWPPSPSAIRHPPSSAQAPRELSVFLILLRKKNHDAARTWLQSVIKDFPGTRAAKRAELELRDLK